MENAKEPLYRWLQGSYHISIEIGKWILQSHARLVFLIFLLFCSCPDRQKRKTFEKYLLYPLVLMIFQHISCLW